MASAQIENLFIRMDKIGDLVLSLNADQWEPLKSQSNHWWVSKGTEFIPELAQPQRAWTSFSKNFSISEWWKCVRWLRLHRPRKAFVFHAPWWVGAALFFAGVPYRIGRWSQWHSFLFFNYGVRQSRSRADFHESQYNIDLMIAGIQKTDSSSKFETALPPPITLNCPDFGQDFLEKWDLKQNSYFVVHPGMAGSALNWPTKNYAGLIRSLAEHSTVVITGSFMDRPYVEPLKAMLQGARNLVWLNEQLSIKELLFVLNNSQGILAPSTGVLHLAASLGVKCFGIYSPRRVQRPQRWGPRGKNISVFVPEGVDPDSAVGSEIMERIKVSTVFHAIYSEVKAKP